MLGKGFRMTGHQVEVDSLLVSYKACSDCVQVLLLDLIRPDVCLFLFLVKRWSIVGGKEVIKDI